MSAAKKKLNKDKAEEQSSVEQSVEEQQTKPVKKIKTGILNSKYQVMRSLNEEEMNELRDSIKANGVLSPIIVDEFGYIIDGHHRMEIIEELSIKDFPVIVKAGLSEVQKIQQACDLNFARRQLTNEDKQQVATTILKYYPEMSNRMIADKTGVNRTTVGELRKALEASGELSVLDSYIGLDGKKRMRPVYARGEKNLQLALKPEIIEHLDKTGLTSVKKARRQINLQIKKEREEREKREHEINKERALRQGAWYGWYRENDCRVEHDDIRSGLPWVSNKSIDAIICDPPYERYAFETEDEDSEEAVNLYGRLFELANRVLKDDGVLLCMAGNYFLNEVYYTFEWLRNVNDLIDLKYYWTICTYTPSASPIIPERNVTTQWKPVLVYVKEGFKDKHKNKYPSDVIQSTYVLEDFTHHRHGQSVEVFKQLVEDYTEVGDTVLDPFGGGGTTAIACANTMRRIFTCDSDKDCVRDINKRLDEACENTYVEPN